MKANRAQIERALARPDGIRLFLLYGPDDSGSRALVQLLAKAMGEGAERVDLTGADLRAEPSRLPDEAASLSMFGDARWVLVDRVGDESLQAVETLLQAPTPGSPVVFVAGDLKKSSKILKKIMEAPEALAFASYVPGARETDRLVLDMAKSHGLLMDGELARQIGDSCGSHRGVIEQELAKYALYADAAPDRPKTIDREVLDLIGADSDEGDTGRLAGAVLDGDALSLEAELARLRARGQEGITLTRSLLRRLALLARLRAEVEQGKSVGAVMATTGKAVFWKEEPAVTRQLGRWRSPIIARAIGRLVEAEREVMRPGGAGTVAAEEELFAICRQAARLR